MSMSGPLNGLTVVEIAGIGPAPFTGMVLADLGATVVRVDRIGTSTLPLPISARHDLLGRGKRSIGVDLKQPRGTTLVRTLAARADVLIEGFRPGVAERLGIGPADVHAVNPKLVYGRMTGWGQDGPLAPTAGHDLTYLARTGILHAIGPADAPVPPINLLGDYGGGGMLLAAGVLAALWHAERTGTGQVVDAAIVDGAALLATQLFGMLHSGAWQDRRAANLLDGGAPFYGVYETADGTFLAVGPLERRFYAEFAELLGLDPHTAPAQLDVASWPRLRALIGARVATRTRDEWIEVFEGSDACVAPVLTLAEAPTDPHNQARGVFVEVDGVTQPAPAPRFTDTPAPTPTLPPPYPGEHTRELLAEYGIEDADALLADAVVG
ncbi:CoA transferase [Phytohabitans aurantiacus]|uniref:CoA transferase n=2 Tax=Phytohabitans aurantiacus TaxID=3016789 RepID=A0ABQ5QNC7_9ACTN|nr:CaiB/BaiF CoA-transferase family protein [Phytohabitans aurantiacus]GLH95467.1 CoA transferase [Phytohabitans aurantiacus]